jgi:hypothetical protein
VTATAAAPTPPNKTTATPSATTATGPTTTAQSGPSLPNTGLDLAGTVAFGAGLWGVGLAVRRRAR